MTVVDAFSADAIPAQLLTKEAIRMYFRHLSEEGILMVPSAGNLISKIGTIFVESHGPAEWRSLLAGRFAGWDVGHMSRSPDGHFAPAIA